MVWNKNYEIMAKSPSPVDYDARWKVLIKSLPGPFIKRFFPKLYKEIDWAREVKFLDKELLKLLADFRKKGSRQGDILMELNLLSGKQQLVLIHIEAQHGFDVSLPERMFITFYRLRDAQPGIPVASMALYTGSKVPKVHGRYNYEFHDTKLVYQFPAFLVREQKEEDLLASDNPIDLAILAALYVIKAKHDTEKSVAFKRMLARLCFERGYSKQETINLFTFVLFLVRIPEQEDFKLNQEIMDTYFDDIDDDPGVIPIVENSPKLADFLLKKFILGKSLKERDEERDKEREIALITRLLELGSEPVFISQALNMELERVKSLIEQIQKNKKPTDKKDPK